MVDETAYLYLDNLEQYIQDGDQVVSTLILTLVSLIVTVQLPKVTYKSLSRTLGVPANIAKQ